MLLFSTLPAGCSVYTPLGEHTWAEQNFFLILFFCFYVRASSSLDGEGKVDLFSLAFFSPSSPASYHIPTLQINQWSTPCAASCGVLPTRFILIHYNLGCTSCSVLQDITEILGGCSFLVRAYSPTPHMFLRPPFLYLFIILMLCVFAPSCMWRSRRKSESNRARLPVWARHAGSVSPN